ncbi:UvrY/SirA/GacA family response regulator transcription factor [Spongorhabdus nitratireducens]
MIRVLIAEDHEIVRAGIARMLEDIDGVTVIGQVASGEDAVTAARVLEPNIVLMDVRMPGIGGLEATRRIVRISPLIRVIALSALIQAPFPSKLLEAGACGYLTKGSSLEEMEKAIRMVNEGKRYINPEIAQQLAISALDREPASPFDCLSHREMQITLMLVHCERVQAISDKLYLSPKTVNSYRYRIFEKLAITSDVELTHLAIRHGLVENDKVKIK